MPIRLETMRVNLWNIVVIAASIAVNASLAGYIWNDTQRDIRDVKSHIDAVDTRFATEASDRKDRLKDYQATLNGMQKDIAQIQPLSFQTTRALEAAAENKKATEATNDRIDRVVESFGGKLDTVIENVNKVATQVQVLSSKLDDMQGKTQHTDFTLPAMRR